MPGVSTPLPLSRRTATGGALALGAAALSGLSGVLSGCDIDPPAAVPSPGEPTTGPGDDIDVRLLSEVLGALDAAVALVAAVAGRHAGLAASLTPLLAMHAEHRSVLAEASASDAPAATATPVAPPSAPAARLAVSRAETRLEGVLARAVVAAESGSFARALASMRAAVAQQVVVLAEAP